MGNNSQKKEIMIDADLYNDIAQAISDKGFSCVDDYANYILRIEVGKKSEVLSDEDTAAVTARLKALGYV